MFKVHATFIIVIYVACELIANVTAGRITTIGPFTVSGAIYIFALTFTLIDLINEGLGKIAARRVVFAAVIANLMLAAYSMFVTTLPAPQWFTDQNLTDAYRTVFTQTPRIVLASITAFVAAGLIDVELFANLRKRLNPGWRVVVSNSMSTLLDALLFNFIAFLGVFTIGNIGQIIIGEYVVKMCVSAISVPLIYLVRTTISIDKTNNI